MLSDNAKGAILMCASMATFSLNDGFMKLTFADLDIAQTLFLRGLVASSILLALAREMGALSFRPTRGDIGPLCVRAVGEIGATASFMIALAHMPIANAMAVLQAAPLAVTMAAALFLGERVRWRRWSAIGVGFIGMLVIVRPGTAEFDVYSISAMLTVIFVVVRDLGTRAMSRQTPTLFASLLSAALITTGAGLIIPFEGWQPVDIDHLGYMAAAGVLVVAGYITSVGSMRVGEVSAVAPFRYTVLIFALVIGYLFFGEVPDAMTFVGGGIVVAAGLYTLWREQMVGQRSAATASSRPFGGAGDYRPGEDERKGD